MKHKHDNITRVMIAREGGHVNRCHIVPTAGTYNVAIHSYNAVSMLLVLHPDPSRDLIEALLWHDVPERWVGDMPAPAKWYSSALGTAYSDAELEAGRTWEVLEGFERLSDEDLHWLDAVDRLELVVWCHDQAALGNRHVQHFLPNLHKWYESNKSWIPGPCREFYENFEWRRLPEWP